MHSDAQVVRLDEWQHVAVTYVAQELRFYVNGQPVGGARANHAPKPVTADLYVGNDETESSAFAGRIDPWAATGTGSPQLRRAAGASSTHQHAEPQQCLYGPHFLASYRNHSKHEFVITRATLASEVNR